MRVPWPARVIQSHGDKLIATLQQKLYWLLTLLCVEDGFAQARNRKLLVIDGFQVHIRSDACHSGPGRFRDAPE